MSDPAPFRQGGNVGWAYAPTMGKFRGLVKWRDGTGRNLSTLCRHEHPTPQSAMTCAAKVRQAVINPGELISHEQRRRAIQGTLGVAGSVSRLLDSPENRSPEAIATIAMGRTWRQGHTLKADDLPVVHQIAYAKEHGVSSDDIRRQMAELGGSL